MERFFPKFTMLAVMAFVLTFSLAAADKNILKAIEENDMQDFKSLLTPDVKINAKDNNGKTLLHYAAWFNRPEMAEYLLSKGADINAKDVKGDTPLLLAASKKFPQMCEFLVSKGANEKVENNFGENYTMVLKKFEGEAKALNTIHVTEKDMVVQNIAAQSAYSAQAKRLDQEGRIVNPKGFYIQNGDYLNKTRNKTIRFDDDPETGKERFTITLQMDDGVSEKVTGFYTVDGDCIYMHAKNYNDMKIKIMKSDLLFEPRTRTYYSLIVPPPATARAVAPTPAPAATPAAEPAAPADK